MDGAPTMTGNTQSFVARFSKYIDKECDKKQLINLHCIINQEALCGQSVALSAILKDVNRIILFICANSLHHSNSLHHRHFREILQSAGTSSEDIPYRTAFFCCLRERHFAQFCSYARKY